MNRHQSCPAKVNIPAALTAAALLALAASAPAGTFATIAIDGSFTDWAGVPVLSSDANEAFTNDINQVQLANDAANFYIRITFHTATNPNASGLFLAFDNDSNSSTGFDIYSLGLIGSEGAYQNDFPFEQATGVFNTGAGTAAAIAISPYGVSTTAQEFSIPRNAVIDTGNNQLLFPNNSLNFGAYFSEGSNDFTGAVPYTFAVPEVSTTGLLGLGVLGTLLRRRRD